ncbi:HlyD family secretion protein [Hydrogenimonas urashimensis]|uniref:HlyD family secretion protein n=1 Tax=Hydrogenimonas urashimensis TaxID=2740515 RepID=UPI001915235E|nr:HlyD family secretion protein [Hydrogenimonas urashimensis]
MKVLKFLLTLVILGAAGWFGWQKYETYMANPWTRDGQVRTQVIQITPRVSGMVTKIYVTDNQHVEKGDPLFDIDPSPFILKVRQAEARLKRAKEAAKGRKIEYERIKAIYAKDPGAVSQKDLVRNRINYLKSLADIDTAVEALNAAKLNLSFTKVTAPVEGWVSNISFQIGSQATANKPIMALVDKNSFWVFGFFREDTIADVRVGDRAVVTLMTYPDTPLYGRVESIAWGIAPTDGIPGQNLLPKVNPVFQWIRLAQRMPIRIELDKPLPQKIKLRVGMTASVQILTDKNK